MYDYLIVPYAVDVAAPKAVVDFYFEPGWIIDQSLGCVFVQRILPIRFMEQEKNTDYYALDVQRGGPVLSEKVQTHVAVYIDVRVVNPLHAFYHWWFHRIRIPYRNVEVVRSTSVVPNIRLDGQIDSHWCFV